MKIVKTIFCTLFGLLFLNAGLDKLLHYMPKPELDPESLKAFEAFIALIWLMPLVGVIEILGGLLFIFPKTRALGAIVILPIMVGIVLHNAVFMPSGLVIAGPLLLINLWMIGDNWEKYKGMFR
jgi:putative oxidoreductase